MRFAYETKDGVAVVTAAAKADLERKLGPLTDKQYRDHVIARSIPEGSRYKELDDNELPDRAYREAWKFGLKGLSVDMEVARGSFMRRVRSARDSALDKLDKDWTKLTGQGHALEAQAVEAERQALRDLPRTVEYNAEGAATTDELTALWPAALK